MMATSKTQSKPSILHLKLLGKYLLPFIKPYQRICYVLIILTVATGILGPIRPYLLQRAIDHYVVQKDYSGLISMTVGIIVLMLIQMIAQYYCTYLSNWLGQHVVQDLRVQLYTHTTQLKTRFYSQTPVGKLVTRHISDTEALADVFNEGLVTVVGNLLQLLAIVVFMIYLAWKLALLSLIFLPLLVFCMSWLQKKLRRAYQKIRDTVTRLNSFVQSRLTGMSTVQIFNRQQQESNQFNILNKQHRDLHNKSILYYSFYFPSLEMIRAIGISILIGYGAREVMQGQVTWGTWTAFLMYLRMLFHPIYDLVERLNTLQMGIVSTDSIIKLLENKERVENSGSHQPDVLQGAITFDKIWFAYEDEDYVLEDISFDIQARQSLAIVGATGAGKSTIINLLTRFYDPQKGTICLDGRDITEYNIQALRKHIGLVLQDVFLFSANIYDNITLGDKTIPQERVIEAAKLVGIHTFIQRLPGSYHYQVQERGIALSVGQRQLLAFARILVCNPCILMLDEATASMDTETEKLIQHATNQLLKNRTAVIIAHRLSTIQHADKIIVLDHGKIQEEGTHTSLLAKNGYYAALYNIQ